MTQVPKKPNQKGTAPTITTNNLDKTPDTKLEPVIFRVPRDQKIAYKNYANNHGFKNLQSFLITATEEYMEMHK